MIICAAIKIRFVDSQEDVKELIICGLRHGNCYETIRSLDVTHKQWTEQGFINHKGEFLNRKDALQHALDCGQLSETHKYYQKDHNIDELYSEDLY